MGSITLFEESKPLSDANESTLEYSAVFMI
jgi:hypothetical protein